MVRGVPLVGTRGRKIRSVSMVLTRWLGLGPTCSQQAASATPVIWWGLRKPLSAHSPGHLFTLGKVQCALSPIAPVSVWAHCFPGEEGSPKESSDFWWCLINPGNRKISKRKKKSLTDGGSVLKHQALFCLNQDIWSLFSGRTKSLFFPSQDFMSLIFSRRKEFSLRLHLITSLYIIKMLLSPLPSD